MIDLIQNSTIHGVNHIYSAKSKFSKLFWCFLFSLGIFAIIINIIFIVLKYFSYPFQVTYSIDYEPFIWPDITICNPAAPYYLQNDSEPFKYWKNIFHQSKDVVETLTNSSEFFRIIHRGKNNDHELEEITVTMASADQQKLEAHVYKHNFIYVHHTIPHPGIYFVNDYKDNNPSDFLMNLDVFFTTRIMQIRNNIPCHTFGINHLESMHPKTIKSLIFYYRFNYDSYKVFNSSYLARSILIYLSNKGQLAANKPIVLLPGFDNIVGLTQSRYRYSGLGRPCRNDVFKIKLYDSLLTRVTEFEGNYETCKEISSQTLFVKNCNCYSPFLPIYENVTGFPRLCLNATLFTKAEILQNAECISKVYNRFKNPNITKEMFTKQCKHYKAIKCEELYYKIDKQTDMFVEMWSKSENDRRSSFNKVRVEKIFGKGNKHKDYHTALRDDFVEFTIKRQETFGDLYVEESAYSFSQLLSDIGGLMGLWLGLSIVGCFEILEFFYLFFKASCNNNPGTKDAIPNTTNEEFNALKIV